MSVEQNCILFFVKSPERGDVKKRLAVSLGETVTAALYTAFVFDALATLDTCRASLVVCFSPPEARKSMVAWLGQQYRYMPQRGVDLGQRMKNGFIDADMMFEFLQYRGPIVHWNKYGSIIKEWRERDGLYSLGVGFEYLANEMTKYRENQKRILSNFNR